MHHESTPGITQELGDDARQKKRNTNYKGSVQFLLCLNVLWIKIIQVSVRKIRTGCQK